jgi:hypothetical protein
LLLISNLSTARSAEQTVTPPSAGVPYLFHGDRQRTAVQRLECREDTSRIDGVERCRRLARSKAMISSRVFLAVKRDTSSNANWRGEAA